jgi:hypothetical protein
VDGEGSGGEVVRDARARDARGGGDEDEDEGGGDEGVVLTALAGEDDEGSLESDINVLRRLCLRCAPLIAMSAFIQRSISPLLSASR